MAKAKRKQTETLKRAVATNKKKAADAEQKRQADVDARWRLYARALLGEAITPDEEAELPAVLDSLGITPEQTNRDQADLEKVLHYRNIIAEAPPQIDALRARAKSLLEQYEVCRRQLKTAGSYEVRRRDMTMRIDAIKHASPQLWKHLAELLPPVEPGTEPQPKAAHRIIGLFSSRQPSPPVEVDDADPEPIEMIESVEEMPGTDQALAAAVANIDVPDAQAEPGPTWPRPIRRFDGVRKSRE